MEKFDFITHDELKLALEKDSADSHFRIAGDFLLFVIDCYTGLKIEDVDPKDIVVVLKEEIKQPLTFDNLNAYKESLQISNKWDSDLIDILLELFNFDRTGHFNKTIELESVISSITEHYRNK